MNSILNFLKKNWYYIAAVVLVVIAVVVIRRRKKNNDDESDGSTLTGVLEADASFPLQPYSLAKNYSTAKGSLGKQVSTLQNIYNKQFPTGDKLSVDGKYGPKSEAAFKSFFADMIGTDGTVTEAQYNAIVEKFA